MITYLEYLKCSIIENDLRNTNLLHFLDEEEKTMVLDYFLSLGSMTIDEEMEKQSTFKVRFAEIENKCEQIMKKFSPLYLKLFVCFSFFVVILFI